MSEQFDAAAWDGKGHLPVLYAKTATGAVNTWMCWVDGSCVCVQWGQQGGVLQVARFRCEPKNEGRANATSAEDQAIKEAIAKWKKQIKKKYFISSELATTSRNLKPMLAKDYHKERHKIQFPVHVQPKFDGVRCLAYYRQDGMVVLQSRGGDPYSVSHIQEQLAVPLCTRREVILDGELYHHGTSLQTINSWVRRPQEASASIVYMVYDIHYEDVPGREWEARLRAKTEFFASAQQYMSHVAQVQTVQVTSHEHVQYYHDRYVEQGYEGAIIRLGHGQYRFGYRSSELLKYKSFQESEFEIVGWARGKGKFENVPTFRLKTADGKLFDATPKGTEQERLELLQNADSYAGRMATIRYMMYSDDGIPMYPLFICLRESGQ